MFTPETLRRLLADSGLAMGEVRYDDTIWRSQIVLPPLALLRKWTNRSRPGLLRKSALKVLTLLNRALASPLEALARARRQGGMIIVPAHRP